MTIRKPAKTYHVHVDRTIVSRVVIEVLGANPQQVAKHVERELSMAGGFNVTEGSWRIKSTEFKAVFVASPEAPVVKLPGFEGT